MGAIFDHCIVFNTSDIIDISGIVVNIGLTIWIVIKIQNNLTNKRVLKDHFITEIKEIRAEYKIFFNNLYSNNITAKSIIPWFKLMNIKVNDIMELMNKKYKINKDTLSPYQNELRELVTNNKDFEKEYQSEFPITFSENSKSEFIKFEQNYNSRFNKLIIEINDKN